MKLRIACAAIAALSLGSISFAGDWPMWGGDPGRNMVAEETSIPAISSLVGHSLAEAKIPQRTGLIVMALHRGGLAGPATHNPGPETVLQGDDVLIVLGRQDQIQRLREYVERGQP